MCWALSRAAVAATGLPAVAYPNRGGSRDSDTKQWEYGDPVDLDLAETWAGAPARGSSAAAATGPADIAALVERLERLERAERLERSEPRNG